MNLCIRDHLKLVHSNDYFLGLHVSTFNRPRIINLKYTYLHLNLIKEKLQIIA